VQQRSTALYFHGRGNAEDGASCSLALLAHCARIHRRPQQHRATVGLQSLGRGLAQRRGGWAAGRITRGGRVKRPLLGILSSSFLPVYFVYKGGKKRGYRETSQDLRALGARESRSAHPRRLPPGDSAACWEARAWSLWGATNGLQTGSRKRASRTPASRKSRWEREFGLQQIVGCNCQPAQR